MERYDLSSIHFQDTQDERSNAILDIYKSVEVDLFEKYGVDKFLGSYALSVHPDYRGRKIAQYLLLARDVICRDFEIKVTATTFTSNASIAAAKKVGFNFENGNR